MSAVRYTTRTRLRAAELRNLGWTYSKVRAILAEEGVTSLPSDNAIRRWADPEALKSRRRADKAYRRQRRVERSNFRAGGVRTPEWIVGRVRSLGDAGLSASAIARVICHDFPKQALTRDQVVGILDGGGIPYSLREKAA